MKSLLLSTIFAAAPNNKGKLNEKVDKPETPKAIPKITASNLIQLILMGAGAPGLGEFDRIDPQTGKMFFKLEANNLVDSEGNSLQTKAKYFNDGYVEETNADKPPGFWGNLISGGRLQSEWEERIKSAK